MIFIFYFFKVKLIYKNKIYKIKLIKYIMSIESEETNSSSFNDDNNIKIIKNKEDLINNDLYINHELNCLISIYLLNIISKNKLRSNYQDLLKKQKKNIFNVKNVPKLSIGDFIYRITFYTKVSYETLISSLILMEKYCIKNQIIITIYNIHRLLFSSILINIKFMEDKVFSNHFYSKICGVNLKDLNKMEYEFICGIQFEIYIEKEYFYEFQKSINQ